MMKKLIASAALATLASGIFLPAQANQISDEMFSLASEPGMGYLGYTCLLYTSPSPRD